MTVFREYVRAGALWLALIAAMLLGLAYYLGYQDGRPERQVECVTAPVANVAEPVEGSPNYVG